MAPPNGWICPFNQQCFCSWRRHCSPGIPSVAPGSDYACLPAGAANGAAWSLIVGFISSSSSSPGTKDSIVRLHRFRVTQSGRILGRSDDALEVLDDVDTKSHEDASSSSTHIGTATAMPGSDGRSLYSRYFAAGHLWAPCFSKHFGPPRLLMKRLDEDTGKWEDVGAIMNLQLRKEERWAGRFLHGYAVLNDRTILLSLQQSGLFVVFDCSTGAWAGVVTTENSRFQGDNHYLLIRERGVYVEEDDTIYFLAGTTLYAYKLCQDQDGRYRMAPPIQVECLCPPDYEVGCYIYGFVTHLGNRIMCSVIWVGVKLRCSCDANHVLITT
ncbi:hypothetical protein QOZ80_6BG0468960 [Eleusine coracana subsp. coracana]|nr:hypothetical protein QOZ80_6BG0468960 [Eleusine coracana subsp. coracana]